MWGRDQNRKCTVEGAEDRFDTAGGESVQRKDQMARVRRPRSTLVLPSGG